jgi:hypothetical protein
LVLFYVAVQSGFKFDEHSRSSESCRLPSSVAVPAIVIPCCRYRSGALNIRDAYTANERCPITDRSFLASLLFYVQHQFEDVYWALHDGWDSVRVALEGSSYLKLPKVLQWFTGNIGLHQIHQVRPNIPNYNLQQCYDEISGFQSVNR